MAVCRGLTYSGLRWVQQPRFTVVHSSLKDVQQGTFVLSVHGTCVLNLPIFSAFFPLSIIPAPWLNPSTMHKLSLES